MDYAYKRVNRRIQDKLTVEPEITNVSDQKRIAVFTLVDGTLTITCDGKEGNVTVSTNTN